MSEPTGEICENCKPTLVAQQDTIAGLQRTVRSQATTIGRLSRSSDQKLRDHAQWKRCERLFKIWQRATGHTRSRFTVPRFKEAMSYLEEYEDAVIERAIEGLAYDPYTSSRRNGTVQRHDGWHLLWKESGSLEEYANKAPLNWRDNLIEHAGEVEGRR